MTLDLRVPYEASVWLERDDRDELAVLDRLLSSGEVFVDGGANIGAWTLVAASAVGPTGTVHAFEPQPAVHAKLVHNTEQSGYDDRVSAHLAAVGAEAGHASLLQEEMHDLSRIVSDGTGSLTVDVTRLDDVIVERPVHGIKLDVEGHELPALEGAESILRDDRPWVCVEFNTQLAEVNRLEDWPVHRHLRERGYRPRLLARAFEPEYLPETWTLNRGHANLIYTAR
jgi:FkbM family methyltransferase